MDCFSLSLKQCRQVKRSSLKSDLGKPAQLLLCTMHAITSTNGARPAQYAPLKPQLSTCWSISKA